MTVKEVVLKSGKTAYRIRVNRVVDGKRKPVVRQCRTKAEAVIIEAHLKLDIANGTYKDKKELAAEAPEIVTLNDYYKQWWPIYITGCESSTAYKTRGLFKNWLLPAFGAMKLVDIKPTKIQVEVMEWYATTATAYHERFTYLNMILENAFALDLIKKNPCAAVKCPPLPSTRNPAYWRPEQIDKFFGYIDRESNPEQYTLLLFLACEGIRPEEVCALRIGDLDMSAKTVAIKHAFAYGLDGIYEKGTKTGAGKRKLPLMEDLVTQLTEWLKVRGDDDKNAWLFPSPTDWTRHIGVNKPNKWFNEVRDASGLKPKITLYGLRHSFISNLAHAGVDITSTYHLAGHSSPDMVIKVYAGLDDVDAKAGVDKLTNYMKGNISGNIDTGHDAKTPS